MSDFDDLVVLLHRAGDSDPHLYGGAEAARASAALEWMVRRIHERVQEARADAWDEGYETAGGLPDWGHDNPYRHGRSVATQPKPQA